PADLSKDLLGRMIAYRLQERAFGGLDRESLRFLDGLARQGGSPRRRLKPGTVLVRDYQGQRHTVTVVSDGFACQGAPYPSLSAIARAIPGTAWSGPRFDQARADAFILQPRFLRARYYLPFPALRDSDASTLRTSDWEIPNCLAMREGVIP